MVKKIMKDLLFLGRKAEAATKEDRAIAEDLLDTLRAHRDYCVGMAANTDAAWALVRMKKRPQKVFLAHLSEENNCPELAEKTVQEILTSQDVNIDLTVARQHEAVNLHGIN